MLLSTNPRTSSNPNFINLAQPAEALCSASAVEYGLIFHSQNVTPAPTAQSAITILNRPLSPSASGFDEFLPTPPLDDAAPDEELLEEEEVVVLALLPELADAGRLVMLP